jgi:O-succinylbenzoate synthase
LARWSALGTGSLLHLTGADVTLVELDFRRPVGTAIGNHRRRPLVMVRLAAEGPSGRVVGWGESAALGDTTFDSEDAEGVFTTLTEDLVPRLISDSPASAHSPADHHLVPGPTDLADRVQPVGVPLAFAALEMAVADVHLRASGVSFAELVGVTEDSVMVGAVAGMSDSVGTLLTEVETLVGEGFARVKLKIGPGWDVVPVTAVRRRFPELILQVDANGSYSRDDIGHLVELDGLDLACIEQPFPRDDLADHVSLAQAMCTAVCLDESLDSPTSVRSAIAMGACEVVCVKPARLGGLGAALEVYRDCRDAGVPLWLGGMFESGYARSVNTALAALPGFAAPGDLSPAAGYLTEDLVSAPRVNRHGAGGRLRVAVHAAPGMGPTPDEAVLARRSVASWHWPAPRPDTAGHAGPTP